MNIETVKDYLFVEELAERWGMKAARLAQWRHFKRGPGYYHLNGRVRYPLKEIEACEAAWASEVTSNRGA